MVKQWSLHWSCDDENNCQRTDYTAVCHRACVLVSKVTEITISGTHTTVTQVDVTIVTAANTG